MATLGEVLKQAVAHHQAGRLDRAAALYRQILAVRPQHPDALHLSGVVAHQRGDQRKAVALIGRAIAEKPESAAYHRNLGNALLALGEIGKAVACQREAIRLAPRYAEAHHSLGEALRRRGALDEAVAAYRRAIRLKPDFLHALNGLGVALGQQGRGAEAMAAYEKALEIEPRFVEAHVNLANTLRLADRADEAVAHFRRALEIEPRSLAALVNLANLLKDRGRAGEAIELYERALAVNPDFAAAHNNLANCLKDQGRVADALPHFERAIALDPALVDAHSNLLLTLHYLPDRSPEDIFAAHRAWAERHAAPLAAAIAPHANDPAPDRRLRLGYVSPDFKRHPVAAFLEPLLVNHDPAQFEVHCYSNAEKADRVTARLQQLVPAWRDLRGLTDAAAAERVRADRIDILVDLAGHTARNRMGLFARKPAPVQASYLGYPDTTGLATVDYRITDRWADPPGRTEAWHTEALVRLESGFSCFLAPAEAPPVGPPPAEAAGHVTFASFNMLAKVSPELVGHWAAILAAVPGARLLLKAPPLADAGVRAYLCGLFGDHGIAPERIEMTGYLPASGAHLGLYGKVDIGLDTFPYNGATTTCEALWMGVPVVTLAGRSHVGRVGVSLLSRLGLEALIASSPADYVARAVALAGDAGRRAALRAELRRRMAASPLMDAAGVTRGLEAAYRQMWRHWCAARAAAPIAAG